MAGGVLASLVLSSGAAVALAASSDPQPKPRPAVTAPAPAAVTPARDVARASRGAGRTALPQVRYVRRTVPVGQSFTGMASWYGPRFHGRRTASGEPFDSHALTAASRTLPFGTRLRVCRADRCVVVRINDRGPYVRGRVLDLSRGAREALGFHGVARVTATPVRTKRVAVRPPPRPVKVSLAAASAVAPTPLPVTPASDGHPVGAASALVLGLLGLAGCGARLRHLRS